MKKILIIFGCMLGMLVLLCFIPFNADRFIPVLEQQVNSQYGVSININKLIFKLGPSIVVKSPDAVLSYGNNEKFADLQGVKIKIALIPLFQHKIKLRSLRIDNANVTLLTDKNGKLVLINYVKPCEKLNAISKIRLKKYHIVVNDNNQQKYDFIGSDLIVADFEPNKHAKFIAKGILSIDNIKHFDYDVAVNLKNLKFLQSNDKIDILDFLSQIKLKNVKASLVADLKIKKTGRHLKTNGFVSLDKSTFTFNGHQLPYSNIDLVMLGDKTSIASKIFADQNSKIVINGFVHHSDNPSFNISVKSNKINLNNLFSIIRLFSDVSDLDKIKNINGTLYANFTLKGNLKHIRSDGFFKINNANIYSNSINMTKLNSDIDFSDNKILIKTTRAFLNSAPVIITGEIVSNRMNINLIINKFRLKNLKFNNLNIKDGILSVVANFSGSYKNIQPRIESELYDLSGKYNIASFRANRILLKFLNRDFGTASSSGLILKTPKSNSIFIPAINAEFDASDINILPFKLISGNTQIDSSGTVSDYKKDDMAFSIKGRGYLNPYDLIKMKEFNNSYPVIVEFVGDNSTREINFQLLQKNASSKVSFARDVIINISTDFVNSEAKIADFSINSYNGVFSNSIHRNLSRTSKYCVVTGSIQNIFHPVFKNVRVNFLKPCPLGFYHYIAKVTGNLVINGYYRNPEFIGNLKVPNLYDKYGCVYMKNVSLALTKKNINFDCGLAKIFDSVISCVGSVDPNLNNGIRVKSINLKSKQLNLDNLSWFFLLSKRLPLKLYVDNGSMFSENVSVDSQNGTIHLTDLKSSFNVNHNVMNISDISANMYNGKLVGNIHMRLSDGKYVGVIQGRSISAGPVMKSLTSLKETISGKLDFDMGIASSLSSKYLNKANVKFVIRDGQMSVLGKVEHLLYAQNIIADNMLKTSLAVISRALTAHDTGLFHYMTGDVSINKDTVEIKAIKMQGLNMSMYVTGYYGITSGIANLNILGRLSNTFISALGSFGTFTMDKFKTALTGEQSNTPNVAANGIDNIPPLPQRYTKEFRSVIMGPIEAPTSVRSFMWLSETEKQYKTKEVPMNNVGIPKFIENLPY